MESESKTLSAVSVSATQDAESLEIAQDVFDANAPRGKGVVVLLLLGCEWMKFALFVRSAAVGVEFVEALVAGVAQQFDGRGQRHTAALEEREVMGFPRSSLGAQNLLADVVNDDLGLLGVALFLSRVKVTLFFWGARCAVHWRLPPRR